MTRKSAAPGFQWSLSKAALAPLTTSIAHSATACRKAIMLAASRSKATTCNAAAFAQGQLLLGSKDRLLAPFEVHPPCPGDVSGRSRVKEKQNSVAGNRF